MVSDTDRINQYVYVNKALGDARRPVESLPIEDTSRLQTVSLAVAELKGVVDVLFREEVPHASILKIMENTAALAQADAGMKEFSAPRNLEGQNTSTVEQRLEEIEAKADSAEGRAEEARAALGDDDLYPAIEPLSAVNEQFAIGA